MIDNIGRPMRPSAISNTGRTVGVMAMYIPRPTKPIVCRQCGEQEPQPATRTQKHCNACVAAKHSKRIRGMSA